MWIFQLSNTAMMGLSIPVSVRHTRLEQTPICETSLSLLYNASLPIVHVSDSNGSLHLRTPSTLSSFFASRLPNTTPLYPISMQNLCFYCMHGAEAKAQAPNTRIMTTCMSTTKNGKSEWRLCEAIRISLRAKSIYALHGHEN